MRLTSALGRLCAVRCSPYARGLSTEMNVKIAPPTVVSSDVSIEFRGVGYRLIDILSRAIVSNISLSISRGETLVLLGRSGSGKTTLLRLINRMLVPSEGQIFVEGRSTTDSDPIRLRRGIGYVIQEAGLFPHFTIAQNIALVPTLEKWDPARIGARVEELLRLVGLDSAEFSSRRPHELSGGQRQRVGVARALAADPPILLMDEPFGALDPVTRAELQREFKSLAARLKKTIVFVTHDIREALLLGQRIALLQAGQVVALANSQDFLRIDHPEVHAFTASLDIAIPGAAR
jgi:osmoprotectant transport system ATP-binding protein